MCIQIIFKKASLINGNEVTRNWIFFKLKAHLVSLTWNEHPVWGGFENRKISWVYLVPKNIHIILKRFFWCRVEINCFEVNFHSFQVKIFSENRTWCVKLIQCSITVVFTKRRNFHVAINFQWINNQYSFTLQNIAPNIMDKQIIHAISLCGISYRQFLF